MEPRDFPDTDLALVIERVVGRDERGGDWRRLRAALRDDPALGGRVLDALESDSRLRIAAAALVPSTAGVPLPRSTRARAIAWRAASGWLAAAVIAGLWLAGVGRPGGAGAENAPVPVARSTPAPTAAPPLGTELPAVLLGAEELGDGRREALLVRRFLDRRPVDELGSVHIDDAGRAFTIPVDPVATVRVRSL